MMTPKTNSRSPVVKDGEIDLIVLAKKMWRGRKKIIQLMGAGAALGLLIAVLSPNRYTVITTIVPQTENNQISKLGELSSLATMVGFDLSSLRASEVLSPIVYPRIVQSLPFQIELMNTPIRYPKLDHPISLEDYLRDYEKQGAGAIILKYTAGLPRTLFRKHRTEEQVSVTFENKPLLSLTNEQEKIREKLEERVSLELNEEEGFLSLNVTLHDAVVAAQVAQKAQSMLQEYITRYKIEKATQQLHFVENRFKEKKAEFEKIQKKLAAFRDRNRDMSTAMAQTGLEQLESDYEIAYSIYSELAKQLEKSQIQVKENTPVLTVIDPVQIPAKKSGPNRLLIIILCIFLGGISGTVLTMTKGHTGTFKELWETDTI
jgi:uncharacterized protein involved in exopolysaccharide biosynthesis